MALIRCANCGVGPPGTGHVERNYVRSVYPVGHPESALVCGRRNCTQPGLIWLEEESQDYNAGERVFRLQTGTVKVRAR